MSTRTRRIRRVRLVAVQGAAVGVAAALLALGIAGFVTGLTDNVAALRWRGHPADGATASLLGAFDVSVALNLLHLGFGFAGLAMARTFGGARAYLPAGGAFFLALWLYGTVDAGARNTLPLNGADNWLHLITGVVMVILGLTLGATKVPTGADGEILVPE